MAIVQTTEGALLSNGGGRTVIGLTSLQVVIVMNQILSNINLQDGGFNDTGVVYDLNDGGVDENHILEQTQHEGGLDTDNN
ncbi:hypothetical protein N8508_00115 [bacterium]|nr:hypothetical protein [bacterium]